MYFGYKDSLFYNKSENKWYKDFQHNRSNRQNKDINDALKTMQPSKMLTDTINILKVEIEKEYVEDSNLLIESLKNELISAIKGEKGDS